MVALELVEDSAHVGRIPDGAIEVGRQVGDPERQSETPDADDALVVPVGIIAAQLDLEAQQGVAGNPVGQQHGVAVVGLGAGELRGIDWVQPADEVPGFQ